MENKKVIGVEQVLQHLKDGMTRDDIAAHYGITRGECKILFQDERLKGKKTIKKPSFVLVQDENVVAATDTAAPEDTADAPEAKEGFGTTATDEVENDSEEEEAPAEEVAKATWD